MSTRTIGDLLEEMDAVVAACHAAGSRLGYFAALYRKVTRAVKRGIEQGRFEDGARMERLDVHFADRYLEAYRQQQQGERPTESWRVAFAQAGRGDLLVTQHLLLGMNAHINLDLGIAAARTSPGTSLAPLQADFNAINGVLAELLDEVQQGLAIVSPSMWMLKRYVRHSDRALFSFQMERAREGAWGVATQLAPLPPPEQDRPIRALDRAVALRGQLICTPVGLPARLLRLVAQAERKDPARVIDCLA